MSNPANICTDCRTYNPSGCAPLHASRPARAGEGARMDGALLAFRLVPYDWDRASELVKRLVGTRTSSHGGKCVVRRKGPLDEIPHRRLNRGVVIVRTEDAGRVVRLL